MATRRQPAAKEQLEQGRLTTTRSQLSAELSERIERGNELLARQITSPEAFDATRADYYTWDEFNAQLLRRRCTTDELHSKYQVMAFGAIARANFADRVRDLRDDIRGSLRRLRSIQEQLPLYEEISSQATPSTVPGDSPIPTSKGSIPADRVFVVHGHNEGRKQEVARYLELVAGAPPIILHEQPSEGRTIIEKLEHYGSQTTFAVVLLTADDEGRLRGSSDQLLPRGRQNVVMELGYFMASLGRSRVVLLYENEVELPSDMTGVLYVRLDDAGGWKLALAKELKSSGIPTDLNALA